MNEDGRTDLETERALRPQRDLEYPAIATAGDVFQLLRDGRPRTRAELALEAGLSRGTIAARVESLISAGFVKGVGEGSSSGGRPPTRFAFDPRSRMIVAVDIGASHVHIALTDLASAIIAEERTPLAVTAGAETVIRSVLESTSRLIASSEKGLDRVVGFGIGLPGPVEHASGRPVKPPIMPGWSEFDVVGEVQRRFRVPVLVDNDVNIMALGERATFWPEIDDLLFVKVATGIGSGVISQGRLQRGADGTAGDIGHIRAPRGADTICSCGNTGCLESIASGSAVAAELSRRGIPAARSSDVAALAADGNLDAIHAIRQAGRDIGEVLAMCINLINPRVVVIGGSLAASGEHLLAGIRESVYPRSLPLATSKLRIVTSLSGGQAAIIGASELVAQHILSSAGIERQLTQ